MINEDYCSYEVAKLLKEKGFNELCFRLIREDGDIVEAPSQAWNGMTKKQKAQFYLCPTHQMAMKWLREMHDLHIVAYPYKSGNDTNIKHYCCQVFKTFNLLGYEKYTDETLTSYEEAVEAALKYSLENLI